jgi:hypothetical protein
VAKPCESDSMENQTFKGYNCDLAQLQKSIGTYFMGKCYKVTNYFKENTYLTQAHKIQMSNKAIVAKIQGTYDTFDVSIGLSEKITNINSFQSMDKIPLEVKMVLAEPFLERNFLSYISTQAELKRNTFGLFGSPNSIPPPPPQMAPVWREREIITEIEIVYCRYCGTKNNARLSTCTKCNASLH